MDLFIWYLGRVRKLLILAIADTAIMVALPWLYPGLLTGLVIASLVVTYLLTLAMLFRLYKPMPTVTRGFLGLTAVAMAFYASTTISPFLILTLASTPYFFPIIAATAFFFAQFETMVRLHSELGERYSLFKLLFNPRRQLDQLRHDRLRNNDINLSDLRWPYYTITIRHGISDDTMADIIREHVTRQNNPADAQIHLINHTDLALSETDKNALLTRQTTAIESLPQALRSRYAEVHGMTFTARSKSEAEALGVHFHSNAEDCIVAQKTVLFKNYRETLTPDQKTQFDRYLEISLKISHATCPITLNPVEQGSMVMEKRYENNSQQHTVPGTTCVFDASQETIDVLFRRPEVSSSPLHPQHRDSLCNPNNYLGKTTKYRYHPYQEIESHPLSLAVCEATEAFNNSMKPNQKAVASAAKKAFGSAVSFAYAALNMHATPRNQAAKPAESFDSSELRDNMTDEELEAALNAMQRK